MTATHVPTRSTTCPRCGVRYTRRALALRHLLADHLADRQGAIPLPRAAPPGEPRPLSGRPQPGGPWAAPAGRAGRHTS